jgi:hypothetical protein
VSRQHSKALTALCKQNLLCSSVAKTIDNMFHVVKDRIHDQVLMLSV